MPASTLWTPAPPAPDGAPVAALAVRGAAAFAALEDGRVYGTHDGGGRWTEAEPGPVPTGGVTALLAPGPHLLAATFDGLFYAPPDGRWTPAVGLPADGVVALEAVGRAVLAGTLRSGVYRSTDGGQTWRPANDGLPLGGRGLEVPALAAGTEGVFAAHAFGLSHSANGAGGWGPPGVGLPVLGGWLDLAAAHGARRGVYAGTAGRLYRHMGGEAWVEVYDGPGVGRPLRLLAGAAGRLFASDARGTLHVSADGGATWAACADGLPGTPETVVAADGWLLAALGPDGLWRRPLGGAPLPAGGRPVELELEAGDPNPFTESTAIAFSLSAPAEVVLTVHDLADAEVARVAEGRYGAGRHHVRFAAPTLPPGFYRCRLAAAGRTQARSLLLLR